MKEESKHCHNWTAPYELMRGALPGQETRSELLELVETLGVPLPGFRDGSVIETLRVRKPENAHPRSQSRIFGMGEFPLHSDGAHWTVPPRFVALACIRPDARPTTILPWSRVQLDESLVREAVFLVKNGRRSFHTNLRQDAFYRYDPSVMFPANRAAQRLLHYLGDDRWTARADSIHWRAGDVLLIDNWRALHGRGASTTDRVSNRELIRILFDESPK